MNQHPTERSSTWRTLPSAQPSSDCWLVGESIDEYVLGVLDPNRVVTVERHLLSCASCAALVASFQQTAAALALSVPQVQPPDRVKTKFMAEIARTHQAPSAPQPVYAGELDVFRTATLPASSPLAAQQPVPMESPAPWWRVYAAPLATLPLLLALGLVAAWGMNNYSQLNHSQVELASRDMQIALLSSQLSTDNSQGVAEVASSPSSKRYTLAPEDATSGDRAQGTLIADPQSQQAVLRVTGLSAGTYAITMRLQDGSSVPKGEFFVNASGSATTLLQMGSEVSSLESVHIRPTASMTDTDVATIGSSPDALMGVIGPDLLENSDTSPQSP